MKNIVFIDSRVADRTLLLQNMPTDSLIVELNASADGLQQIADTLKNYANLDAVHIVSHGSAGALYLGSSVINNQALASYTSALSVIGNSLTNTGDILLYGCNVAEGDAGKLFISALARMTGADVAASTDSTGGSGDWVLEQQTGNIEANKLDVRNNTAALGMIDGFIIDVEGTEGTDWNLQGTDGPNHIYGYGGNDYMYGNDASDTLEGGSGNDYMEGDAGADLLQGDAGNDDLRGDDGDDVLWGGSGNDTLKGGSGTDTYLYASGDGQERIDNYDYGSSDVDSIGLDSMIETSMVKFSRKVGTDDLVIGFTNNSTDAITVNNYFSSSADSQGYSRIVLNFGDGTIWDASDISRRVVSMEGTTSSDSMYGTVNPNSMRGLNGNDYLYGYDGNDTLEGGDGSDQLEAGDGDDILRGDAGNDRLYGNSGNDTLTGGDGNDILEGNSGVDTYLFGIGSGQDQVNAYDYNSGDIDIVKLGAGITTSNIRFARALSTDDLLISIDGKTDTIAISNYFSYSAEESGYQRIKLVFSDSTEWSAEDIASSVVNVIGNSSGNSLYGTVNPNLMRGDAGNDYLYGYAGSDTLEGGDGSDQLEGGDDSDVLKGDAGNDRLYGNSGDDTLNGGADNDILEGNAGADTYLFDSGSGQDQINAYDYNNNDVDTVSFGAGIVKADVKLARALATDDLVVSFTGKTDTLTLKDYFGYYASLNGYSRVDFQFTDGSRWEEQDFRNKVVSMEGSSSSNSLYGTGNPNLLRGNAGNDYLYGYSQKDTLEGGDGNDQLEGGDDNDTLQGDAGNDSLYGNSGNDTLNGGVGNDYLQGDAGVDVYRFSSGSGQDVINAYDYNNSDIDIVQLGSALTAAGISFARAVNTDDLVLRFADWTDTLTIKSYFGYSAETQGYSRITLKFSNGSAWDAEAISKKVINMTGTGSNETMYGTANSDSILGNGGNDYLYGMDGNDTLDGGSGSDYIEGNEGDDVLNGGDGNDRLYGKDGDDVFYGGDGNDQMEGGAGADVYVFGIGSKQDEINAYDYNSSSIDVVQLGAGITTGAIRMSRTSDDLLIRISNNDNDKLTIKNYFSYNAETQGYSRIALKFTDGSSWSDGVFTIVDSNHAPTGNVTISGTPAQGQTLRAVSTLADADGLGVLQYQWLANNVAINGATGSTFALTQAQVGKTISVQTRYTDNLGHDESVLSAATRAVTAVQNPGILFTNTNALTTTEAGGRAAFQVALRAEPRHDVTLTFTLSDKTEGKFLSTGGAISTVTFTASNWNAPQTVTVVGVDDNLNDDNITYNLSTSVRSEDLRYDGMRSGTGLAISNLTITNTDDDQSDEQYGDAGGAAIADLLNGGNGASDLYGLNGRDELHGGNGDDRLYGGNGDDVLYGEAHNDELEGDQGNDKLYGGAGNDTLTGGTGRDSLYGGDGNDILDGSSDRDFMDGGNGADIYYVDNVGDMVSDSGTDTASDTVYISVYLAEGYTLATGIDNATLDALASNAALTGNSGKNILTGNSGDNTLSGGSGNDTLNGGSGKDNLVGGTGNDVLDGGVSADTLSGGAGDDVYVINSGDRISETTDAGVDTVQSSISYVLAKNFEKLLLSGSSALKGTGNTADNELTGNVGANELSGDAGNDILIGGEGKDTLTGGAGRDVFKLEKLIESGVATAGRDVIGDFVRGEDKIGLSALDANTQLAGDQAFTAFIKSAQTFTAAGQLQLKSGVLYGNTDNDADAEFSIALTGITTLGMTDVIA